jgi:hypothetical protein
MIALVDPLPHTHRRRDIEHDHDLAPSPLAPNREPGLPKDAQRRGVIGQHLRVEPADPPLRGDRRELLKQPRGDPATPEIVRHRKRNLGGTRLAQTIVARDRHHSPIVPADQREPVNPAGLNHVPGRKLGAHSPVKAHVPTLRREPIIERLHLLIVLGPRRDQPQTRPIPQNHVTDHELRPHRRRPIRKRVRAHRRRHPIPSCRTRNSSVPYPPDRRRNRERKLPRRQDALITHLTLAEARRTGPVGGVCLALPICGIGAFFGSLGL